MSPAQLADLWADIRADEEIPWRYTPDCCYSRAHRMYHRAKKKGLDVKKVCVKPKPPADSVDPLGADGKPLDYFGRTIEWHYHVAIIVEVDLGNGKTEKRVLDPALCPNGPVPLEEWLDKMGGRSKLTVKEYDPDIYYPGRVDPDGSKTEKTLEEHRAQYQSDVVDYINRNPGILDLPKPMTNPSGGGVLCSVNNIAQRRGDAFAMVSFSRGVGRLKLQFDHHGMQMLQFLQGWGLQREEPVMVVSDRRKAAVANVSPAHRRTVLGIDSTEQFLRVVTMSPTTYQLSRKHPQYSRLHRMLNRAVKQGDDVLFGIEAGSSELIEVAVPASRFDRLRRATEAPRRDLARTAEGREI